MQNVPKNVANRFDHIDGLRAFAVLLVVFMHSGFSFFPGGGGVTVFLGISGFIITYVLLREREVSGQFDLRSFYVRRAFKLIPPFIVAIVIPTLVYWIFNPINIWVFLSQIFFSYNWVRVYGTTADQVLPGSSVVWSLAVEEQFYILFSLIWLLFVRFSWWRSALLALSGAAILGSTGLRVVLAQKGELERVIWGTDARLDAIAWGILASVLVFEWQRGRFAWFTIMGRDSVLVVAGVLFLGGMVFRDDGWLEHSFRPIAHVMSGILFIVYGMMPTSSALKKIFYSAMAWGPVQLIGLASYSIYLVHNPLKMAILPFLMDFPLPVRVILIAALGTGLGIVLYRFVEVPSLAVRKNMEAARGRRSVGKH